MQENAIRLQKTFKELPKAPQFKPNTGLKNYKLQKERAEIIKIQEESVGLAIHKFLPHFLNFGHLDVKQLNAKIGQVLDTIQKFDK